MNQIMYVINIIVAFFRDLRDIWRKFKELTVKQRIISIVLLLAALCIVASVFSSCASPGVQYINANKNSAELMLPDLIQYIKNDPKLSDIDKEVRIKAVETWLDLNRQKATALEVK